MTSTRLCPSCVASLPFDAVFCHKCGTATPMEIDASTGQIHVPELSGVEEDDRRAKLQAALGDSCEVRRLLGRGGFAEVYVAYDKRLKREIAVKTIRGDLVVNDMLLERFQREAEAVAKLRHPNIVPIYAVGEADGLAYFTMPLIEGISLADALEREGRFSVAEGCRILRESANALHAAHRMGLVHRDIKPENVMLEGPERSAVVMDFGIAKTDGSDAKGLTGTGMLVGTPQYMSPEQAVGDRGVDARSDQYSLAMVGYRMLTGKLPFESDSIQTQIFKTVTEVPAPASDIVPSVPKEVSDVLAKALSKRQEDRYESMAAFSAALDAHSARDDARNPSRGWRNSGPDMATRVRLALQSTPTWRHPLVLAAAASLIAGLLLFSHARSRVGTAVASNKAEAVFAAKAFLRERGVASVGGSHPSFDTKSGVLEFLQRTLTTDSAERRAATDLPVWRWSTRFGRPSESTWTVDVGPDNRVVGFKHKLADSLPGATISHDSARVLAQREVVARGWPAAAIEPTLDSTITRKKRTDHLFKWRKRADAIQWRGNDSASVELRSMVAGSEVSEYSMGLKTPDSYSTAIEAPTALKVFGGIGISAAIIFVAFAFGLGTTRQRVDEMQWGTVLRLLGVSVVLLLPLVVPMMIDNVSFDGSGVFSLLFGIVLVAACFAAVLYVAVVGESLASERHPIAVQGLGELARGRSLPPEIVSGTLWGYVYAALILGVTTVIGRVAIDVLHSPAVMGTVNGAYSIALPSTYALVSFAATIIAVLAILYAVSLASRWRAPLFIALCVPALIYVAATSLNGHLVKSITDGGVPMLIIAFVIWRYGFLAGVLAFWLPDIVRDGVELVASGNSEFVVPGFVTLVIALVPLAVAITTYRRLKSRATESSATRQ